MRSKTGGDLARSRLRSSDRSQRQSMTDLVIEPLIEHVHDEDISEELYSGSFRDLNKSPRSGDASTHRDTSSSAENTVVTIPHSKLTKTTSAATVINAGKFDIGSYNGVFPKWGRTFFEFREADKSMKHELGSIERSPVTCVFLALC